MPLLNLPPELLTLIAQNIGAFELRKSVAYLLVSKCWYRAILPVYISDLPLSDLYLASHNDLEILPSVDTALANLIQAKTKRLSVRLVGHPCKCPSVAPWHDDTEIERGHDGMKKLEDWHCDWTTVGPVRGIVGCRSAWRWYGETRRLHRWGRRINTKLLDLAAITPISKNLVEFSFEAASESDGEQGPQWDYLHDTTICNLISSLPLSLNNLTLDMCGSRAITPDSSRDSIHLCPLVAERLHDFQNIRLRLRCICPQILSTSSSRPETESRLKTLVIRLSLPFFPDAIDGLSKGNNNFDAKPCDVSAIPLYKRMVAAAVESAISFPELSMMRISYRQSGNENRNTCLHVADCLRKRYMYEGSEIFCYEDDGSQWEAWENSESLQDLGSLRELLR